MRLVILSALAFAVGLGSAPWLLPPRYQYVKLGEYPGRFDRRTGAVELMPITVSEQARAWWGTTPQAAAPALPAPRTQPAQPLPTAPGLMAGK